MVNVSMPTFIPHHCISDSPQSCVFILVRACVIHLSEVVPTYTRMQLLPQEDMAP